MNKVKALVFTGYGLNCDYETDYSLRLAGADSHRVHINQVIDENKRTRGDFLRNYHIMVFGGGFSWGDDHGAGVLMASKLKNHMGREIIRFIEEGKLIIGICNGFQTLANLGLLPGFDSHYNDRRIALVTNDRGNFIDMWVNLKINPQSPCVFTRGISMMELPVRHGEGKFFADSGVMERLLKDNMVVMQYADADGTLAQGKWPQNPNGSLYDIAGVCDPTGRIFGLMPHPEAFNHYTNHPQWPRKVQGLFREGRTVAKEEGDGIRIFRNAVEYVRSNL